MHVDHMVGGGQQLGGDGVAGHEPAVRAGHIEQHDPLRAPGAPSRLMGVSVLSPS